MTVYDLALVPMMIGVLGHCARREAPDLWRRQLTIILDGFRYQGAALPGKPPSATDIEKITGS